MRVAALLSGWPRFCADWDSQLDLLKDYNVDWYCGFWNPGGHSEDRRVSPGWRPETAGAAAQRIAPHLPPNHRIALLELVDWNQCPPPQAQYQGFYCDAPGVHRQYSILQHVDLRRQQAQVHYDLVIRTRPDIGLRGHLDLEAALATLSKRPEMLLLPHNERKSRYNFCDQWCAALPGTMCVYTQVVQHFDTAHTVHGVPYNPEYLLGHILSAQGLTWPLDQEFYLVREQQGQYDSRGFKPVWGRWL